MVSQRRLDQKPEEEIIYLYDVFQNSYTHLYKSSSQQRYIVIVVVVVVKLKIEVKVVDSRWNIDVANSSATAEVQVHIDVSSLLLTCLLWTIKPPGH